MDSWGDSIAEGRYNEENLSLPKSLYMTLFRQGNLDHPYSDQPYQTGKNDKKTWHSLK